MQGPGLPAPVSMGGFVLLPPTSVKLGQFRIQLFPSAVDNNIFGRPFSLSNLQDVLLAVTDTTPALPKPRWEWGSTITPSLTRRHPPAEGWWHPPAEGWWHPPAEGWWHLPTHTRNKPGVPHCRQPAAPGALRGLSLSPQCQHLQPSPGALSTEPQRIPHPAAKNQCSAA